MLYWLVYMQSGGGFTRLSDVENGAQVLPCCRNNQFVFISAWFEQERKFKGGTQLICQRLAAALGSAVHLNAAVAKVEWDDGSQHFASMSMFGIAVADWFCS